MAGSGSASSATGTCRRWAIRSLTGLLLMAAALSCCFWLSWVRMTPAGIRTCIIITRGEVSIVHYRGAAGRGQPFSFGGTVDVGFRFNPNWAWNSVGIDITEPLALPLAGASVLMFWLTRRRTPSPGHCACGYALQGLTSDHCPECGRLIAATTP